MDRTPTCDSWIRFCLHGSPVRRGSSGNQVLYTLRIRTGSPWGPDPVPKPNVLVRVRILRVRTILGILHDSLGIFFGNSTLVGTCTFLSFLTEERNRTSLNSLSGEAKKTSSALVA